MKYKLATTYNTFFERLKVFVNEYNQLPSINHSEVPEAINNLSDKFLAFIKESIDPFILELEFLFKDLYWQEKSFKHSFFLNSEQENLAHNLREVKINANLLLGYFKMISSLEDKYEEIETISMKMDFILNQLNKCFDDNYYSVSTIFDLNQISFRDGEPEEIVEDLTKRGYVIPIDKYQSSDLVKISVKGAKYIERKSKIEKSKKAPARPMIIDSREKIDQLKYLEISNQAKLHPRCPILNYCARRAYTIYFFSEYSQEALGRNVFETLKAAGQIPNDFEKNMIQIQGEQVTWSKSANLIYYNNTCPEVNLFDSDNALPFASNTASNSGDWDDFRDTDKFKPTTYRHYSQCGEYCAQVFEKATLKKGRKRSPISPTLRFEIFQRDNFTCQYCGRSKDQKTVLVIDHVVPYSDGGKDEYNNLITSCQDCNSGKSNKVI